MDSIFTLLAISSGAVFMGAMTYIGNAPNFMVRSIAEENNNYVIMLLQLKKSMIVFLSK